MKNVFENMKDSDLVVYINNSRDNEPWCNYNKAVEALWKRYQNQVHRNWHKLCKALEESGNILSLHDDFYEEAQEVFLKALEAIDISKIRDNDWKFVGYFDYYLRNLRTRFHKEVKKMSNMKSIDSLCIDGVSSFNDPDVEISYWRNEGYKYSPEYALEESEGEERCKEAVNKCMASWNETQRKIFSLLLECAKKKDISKTLNIPLQRVYVECNRMKNDMKKFLGVD